MTGAGASVIRKHPDLHVVQLSSAGAFLRSGTGPIVGHYETEEKFRAAGKNIVSVRPNEFMENVFFALPTILAQDSIYTSIPGSEKAPFIATQDIAEIAAEYLLNPVDGHHVIDIVGPQEISFDEWARIAGQAIGRNVRVVTIPGEKLKAAMHQAGMSQEMAALLVEMEEAYPKIQGSFKGEQKRTGKVTFLQFAREVFAPGYKKAVQSAAWADRVRPTHQMPSIGAASRRRPVIDRQIPATHAGRERLDPLAGHLIPAKDSHAESCQRPPASYCASLAPHDGLRARLQVSAR